MRPKIALVIFAAVLPFAAWAQTKLHLDFDSPTLHKVWISEGEPSGQPVEFQSQAADLPIDQSLSQPTVWVEDEKTGNMASHPLASLGGKWLVKEADYTSIAELVVRVESKGKPVASAEVGIKGPKLDKHTLLAPSNNGELTFYNVPPGTISLNVGYKVDGKDAEPIQQSFAVALKRDKAQPTLIVSIPDNVDVVTPSPTPGATPTSMPAPGASGAPPPLAGPATPAATPAPQQGGGSFLGQLVMILIVLGVVGGGIWYLLQMMKKNGETVQDKLRQLGVDVPKPINDPGDAAAATQIQPIRQSGPPEKIMLGGATPDPTPISNVGAVTVSGTPTLRMPNGDAFELPEGETTVGRELGLALSFVNESTVSRQHATITRHGNDVKVKDLGSSNGTFVNGAKVTGEANARPGDTIQFGSVQCRLEG